MFHRVCLYQKEVVLSLPGPHYLELLIDYAPEVPSPGATYPGLSEQCSPLQTRTRNFNTLFESSAMDSRNG